MPPGSASVFLSLNAGDPDCVIKLDCSKTTLKYEEDLR